ncbi:citrate synthase/methylcitrate synthase [Aquibium oceanicum]|uniref:Citrate synthase n=1 Tax=Aquibium oceanicum TaxID=1670800 RepID=A0A1L3SX96_9HYPH|nr:citrate synthase/methylcitrate synthase [Aquibium oceanicum]APH74000.1 citrate synthase/methylcitrate synthase [Aquibium oceanicum]
MTLHSKTPAGLDGVIAAATALSHVDGERGELVIAGHRLGELAQSASFEAVTARLWSLAKGEEIGPERVKVDLGIARERAFETLPRLLAASEGLPVVSGFRAAVAALGPVEGLPDEAAIVGAMPVIAAALARRAAGLSPVAPDPSLGHAADTLRMLRGEAPAEAEAKALDAYLVTVCDHGMNASTFAARVVASTNADLFMAVTAGYCALTGPLHGGAPEPVLAMLDAIGSRENIAGWIDAALSRGERLMGFGHRIYRVRDPRADVLRKAVGLLGGRGVDLGFAAEVEAYGRDALAKAKPDRPLDTNVEFYTAILLDALRIPRAAFTPVFATGRAAGWTAHAREQQRTGRLLRPASLYTGVVPG